MIKGQQLYDLVMGQCISNSERAPIIEEREFTSYEEPKKAFSPVKSQESLTTGEQSSKMDSLFCQLCNSAFNGEQRPPLLLCINEHNACRECVNGFYPKNIKNCPVCSFDFKLIYNQQLLLKIEKVGVSNNSMQLRSKPKANRDAKQETYRKAEKFQYKQVLQKLKNAESTAIEDISEIHEKLSSLSHPIDLSIFVNLVKLEITFTELQNIEYFGCLPELRVLNLCSNKISRIDHLYTYYRLESLNLEFNRIKRIQNIKFLSNLKQLSLEYNHIHKIQNLECLQSLQTLKLTKNSISRIENLERLKSLRVLRLDHNQIYKVEGLEHLTLLQQLGLSDNAIAKLENLSALQRLKKLWIARNKIESIQPLCELSSLAFVDMKDNPTFQKENSVPISILRNKKHVQLIIL